MASAIIRMAESFRLETLVEGVESVAEQVRLAEMGCRYILRFGIVKLKPFEERIAEINRHNAKLKKDADPVRKAD